MSDNINSILGLGEDKIVALKSSHRSGWSVTLRIFGCLGALAIPVGFLVLVFGGGTDAAPGGLITILAGIASALNCFFAAFLLDVFTDIRGYLQRIAEK